MSFWLKVPWFTLSLVVLSYSLIGWHAASWSSLLSVWLVEEGQSWGWLLRQDAASAIIQIAEVVILCLISLALTAPVAIITLFISTGLRSDAKALISLLGWSIIIVLIIRWFPYFVHLLVLFCAAILGRLQLQQLGYNRWQVTSILISCCLAGVGLGWVIFIYQ